MGWSAGESNLVPAVFGAIFAQFGRDYPKVAGIGFVSALSMTMLLELGYLCVFPGFPLYMVIIVSVFGTILIPGGRGNRGMIEAPEDS